jgi:hypothetical protein
MRGSETSLAVNSMTNETQNPKYHIDVGKYGGITVEAPTKGECIEMFNAVASKPTRSAIDEAIR